MQLSLNINSGYIKAALRLTPLCDGHPPAPLLPGCSRTWCDRGGQRARGVPRAHWTQHHRLLPSVTPPSTLESQHTVPSLSSPFSDSVPHGVHGGGVSGGHSWPDHVDTLPLFRCTDKYQQLYIYIFKLQIQFSYQWITFPLLNSVLPCFIFSWYFCPVWG